jgi:hypothetical protein
MSAPPSRIRIEDEVWEEAFSSPVGTRRGRTGSPAAAAPVRAAQPSRYEIPADGGRRTIRIEGRGADPLRGRSRDRTVPAVSPPPRTFGGSPDRLAMWAALLGFLLVVVAILSSHF